ncbi:diacylglycerol kinase [Vampirovibrio sp.]|uniref:diacylglycerol kinase n=1 Tax=Vampirovibrio sp. TaxID=2717857 RepID=UPI003593FF0D
MKAPTPTPQHPFKSRSFLHSLGYAINGLVAAFKTERNFRAHMAIMVAVMLIGAFLQVKPIEWALLIMCMTLMVAVETLNTALEYLVDLWVDGVYNEKAKLVKDIAAGACLVTAIGVAISGGLIFWPYLQNRF